MIETLLLSFTGVQLIPLLIVTVVGGFWIGTSAYWPSEIIIGCGAVLFFQIYLFWTSAQLEMVLYGYEIGFLDINPDIYVLVHHAVQLSILWVSFTAGRATVCRN